MAFTERARSAAASPPPPPAVPLTHLCVIRGCLNPREGANLCPKHQHATTPGTDSTP
jgi:hypothetical protein